jgi:hypothetical protein
MSLTAFNRQRRMRQVEEMKPENIVNKETTITEEPKINKVTEEQDETSTRRRTRRTNA